MDLKERKILLDIYSYLEDISELQGNCIQDELSWSKDSENQNREDTKKQLAKFRKDHQKTKKCINYVLTKIRNESNKIT